jgi:hypothetical protein
MEYRVVFDVSGRGYEAIPYLGVIVPVLLGLAFGAWAWRARKLPTGPQFIPFVFAAVLCGSLAIACFWFLIPFRYAAAAAALHNGTAQVVEGQVENFHPMPRTGHDTERFTVNGVLFSYSDAELTPGFNQTSSHGGPIREGLDVRIHYIGIFGDPVQPTILKLEIRQ